MLRMHPSFKEAGEKPFDLGYAIVDPTMPDRVARDAKKSIEPEKGQAGTLRWLARWTNAESSCSRAPLLLPLIRQK